METKGDQEQTDLHVSQAQAVRALLNHNLKSRKMIMLSALVNNNSCLRQPRNCTPIHPDLYSYQIHAISVGMAAQRVEIFFVHESVTECRLTVLSRAQKCQHSDKRSDQEGERGGHSLDQPGQSPGRRTLDSWGDCSE